MKRFALIAVLALSLAPCLMAQQPYVDVPTPMAVDTAYVRTRITRTINFLQYGNRKYGVTDLDIYSKVKSGTDTTTVLLYLFKYKQLTSGSWVTDTFADSVVLGTIALTSTYKWYHFYVDDAFENYPIADGGVVVYKKGGSDEDSTHYYTSFRITP